MKLRDTSHVSESERLGQRLAKLEEKLFGAMERISQLEEENARLREEVARLQQQLAAARKNSSTSSKPPSSDMVKPPKPPRKDRKKRKRGGQPGHEQHLRSPFPTEAVDRFEPYTLECCPDCGGSLRLSDRPPNVLQQVEIAKKPAIVTEHRGLAYWCPHCRKFHYAPLPEAVIKAGLFGPRLTALVAFMKGVCHASFATIRKFLRDVACIPISRGYLAKLIAKVSQSLAKAYAELFERLPSEPVLNIDETGHKENGQKFWTWCFRAQVYTLFRIDKSRGSKVLVEVLGKEFNGVLGCDYFGAYRKYMREFDVLVQFCLAHLIRDVKFLMTLPGREDQAYGKRVRQSLRELFAVIHRREKMSEAGFQKISSVILRDISGSICNRHGLLSACLNRWRRRIRCRTRTRIDDLPNSPSCVRAVSDRKAMFDWLLRFQHAEIVLQSQSVFVSSIRGCVLCWRTSIAPNG